ncbi:sugar transferase [Roseivirga pacifica]|uniref:sugar transferase n=1 Tax=Roseivirga pacifica TaxID=1267423 RepID=UPI002095ECC0|nr:sugar transferase [Roseivirga pacifica]MCO6357436.1 lipid carrier--UDP-N-acetylgalactosaminyltransferase [Roseivirga pacifica]MCO6367800.1 lipid carrier--UDP-N-acetylgalactosaminyltransferase [Roseivirga pacifica]MCO6369669.1 lipid carrier--UDP-N-acetylgalactosaminyltransferase [Roseivirga pacifica]MCO6373523.1 lipid carrier--UDP-N-acetylgalactosaminyltransferase [Roseivirga pacifica]MCO6377172.1 lipid carrier--UDP-N-acetylgalactosaminyltransferase [Roseivirga pacifica]
MYKSFTKRLFDFLAALAAFLLLFPLFLLTTVLLAIVNDGKPFFFQTRPGRNGCLFKIFKFKTMNDKRDSEGNLLPDADRLTVVGQLVRKLSLDEIPQLLNVIKGDMSLVGPRPLLVEYLPLYNERQAMRHNVRPGITGWAQVNGRNAIDWQTKFELDVWYVEHLDFWLDIKILFLTVKKVFVREGISSDSSVTMEKFTGNQ